MGHEPVMARREFFFADETDMWCLHHIPSYPQEDQRHRTGSVVPEGMLAGSSVEVS